MGPTNPIDTTFDFQSDTPAGKDPDTYSPTLRRYHKWLWSKPLPNGAKFELTDKTPRTYLHHKSEIGEFWLSSDTVIPSFHKERKIKEVITQISDEIKDFNNLGYTIGGMMLFPGNQVGRKITINGARGCHPRIKDRFDLTVECIRRHYCGGESPLVEVLQRYDDFFQLFGDFKGYVDFWFLQDIVSDDYTTVKFFSPFDDRFPTWPFPKNLPDYLDYMACAIEFLQARNRRMKDWAESTLQG